MHYINRQTARSHTLELTCLPDNGQAEGNTSIFVIQMLLIFEILVSKHQYGKMKWQIRAFNTWRAQNSLWNGMLSIDNKS